MADPAAIILPLEPGLNRVDVPSAALGFGKPPCQVDLRFVHASTGWTMVVSCEDAVLESCTRWLHNLGALDVARVAPRGPTLLRARFHALPETCEAVLDFARTDHVVIASDGLASILVRGPDAEARRVARALEGVALPGIDTPPLTERQDELLRFCVERGYYSIPRRISLQTLTKDLGISTTSLSLALRRAEAKIILAYTSRVPPVRRRDGPPQRAGVAVAPVAAVPRTAPPARRGSGGA